MILPVMDVELYLLWLKDNAFWNQDLVYLKESPLGGIGVFWNLEKPVDPSFEDAILLRVPKSNILSPKNSLIYNLLVDYNEMYGSEELDLSSGMHALIISFIYELNMDRKSPWFEYLAAIDPNSVPIDSPLCLWNDLERKCLSKTECGILGMTDLHELVILFEECVKFAANNENLISIPPVFKVDLSQRGGEDFKVYKDNLETFGKYVQAVISRAFQVDEYHGPSLVPGADLFNHLSPILDNDEIQERENVHFVCDADVCHICGEGECDHEDEDEEDDIEEIKLDDIDGESGSEKELEGLTELIESDMEVEQTIEEDEDSSVGEITMEYIEKLEQLEREEAEKHHSDVEEDLVQSSDQESASDSGDEPSEVADDLHNQLSDSSKCVDIVLVSPPDEKHDYEIFNTYGNELSNPYLLQRYGFVSIKDEPNINDSCLLNVQLMAHINRLKKSSTSIRLKQLEAKLEWLEDNFDIIAEILSEIEKPPKQDEEGGDDEDEESEEELTEVPESWQLSAKVHFSGNVSIYTILILTLIELPFKIFNLKLFKCPKNKLDQRIVKYLLESDIKVNLTITDWCERKLGSYIKPNSNNEARQNIIENLIFQEEEILKRALGEYQI